MSQLSKHLKTTVPFEPLIMDALSIGNNGITEQHARILASLFKLGGYTTLNVLVSLVKFAQPTVSLRVQELEDYGYLRKNPEMIPTPLVMDITPNELRERLNWRSKTQSNAMEFLLKLHTEGIQYSTVQDTFIKAFRILFPHNQDLANLLAYTYIYPNLSREKIFELLKSEEEKPSKVYEELLTTRGDIFHVVHRKKKKSDINLRPRLPLTKLLEYHKFYLDTLNNHYHSQLEDLDEFMVREYDSFIPHQYLNFLSEIKAKIGMCLRHYSQIKVISNGILEKKFPDNKLLQIIAEREEITTNHTLSILTTEDINNLENLDKNQYRIKKIEVPRQRDFSTRDFIIFENRGCLIIPERFDSQPYYYIGPRFMSTMNQYFDSEW